MTAPRELSGVAASQYELLRSRAIEAQHPGLSEELEEVEAAIDATERAVEANKNGLVEEIGRELRAEIERAYAPAAAEVDSAEEAETKVVNSSFLADELISRMRQLSPEGRDRLINETLEEAWKDVGGKPTEAKAA